MLSEGSVSGCVSVVLILARMARVAEVPIWLILSRGS